ncbi:ABC transporter permease [Altererythrobacter sp. ZODW24]|uniref:ABC transporter permease n=1 Tax=Altererythrobacter sp. ZODW24 TaxID=2185142 RepID=UPI000DF84849|nr:ABC transporter permease [Altererythrobacter sp. ZODW24]
MRAIDLKLMRDLWHMRGQALAIGLVIGGAMAVFVMAISTQESLEDTRDVYYERNHYADVFANMTRAPASVAQRAGAIRGVRRAEGRIVQFATLELDGRTEPIRAVINSVGDGGRTELNQLVIIAGRAPDIDQAAEVVIDRSFAEVNELAPGDEIIALIYGTRQSLQIVGIGLAPDYIYSIPPGDLVPDESRFGIFWMGREALEAATDRTEAINSVSLSLEAWADESDVIRELDTLLAPYGGTGAYGRDDHISHAFLTGELDQLDVMSRTIPPVFLLVSTFLIFVVLGRLIQTEREQIGLLKAFGYSDRAIAWHYIKFAIAMATIGIVFGAFAGAWQGQAMSAQYAESFRFPLLYYRMSTGTFLSGALLAAGSATIGSIGGVRSAIKLTPAVAMAPPPPVIYREGILERRGKMAGITSIGQMILRHLLRFPMRSSMTVIGVALSLALLFSMLSFISSATSMLETHFGRTQRQDLTVTMIEPRNEDVLFALASLPGVMRVEPTRAVSARLTNGARSERVAIESGPADGTLSTRIGVGGDEVPLPAGGLMLSRQLADKLDAAPGDELEVAVLEGRRTIIAMPMARTIDELVGTRVYADSATVARLTRDAAPVSAVLMRIDPAHRETILAELRDMPLVLGVTEREAAMTRFRELIDSSIASMIWVYIGFASLIAVGVVYNGARILFSERARELATLRVLGYHAREVALVLLGEVAVLVFVAIPVGCFAGYWMAMGLMAAFGSDLFRLPFEPERSTFGFATAVVLAAASLTAVIVARRVLRLDMVRVLKARD